MTDLKLIDELLCVVRQRNDLSWEEMERDSVVTREAMDRLRRAWRSGEMPVITLGLANYFDIDRIRG
jgi:hypothetical protein